MARQTHAYPFFARNLTDTTRPRARLGAPALLGGAVIAVLIALFAAAPRPALAVGGFEPAPTQSNAVESQYQRARELIDAGKPAEAVPVLEAVIEAEPGNANAWNLLAFANRKLDKLDLSLEQYRKALALDPEHRGAHEYLGELYLRKGDLPAAEKMRASLARLCVAGCEELEELDEAIAAFKKGSFKPAGAW